MTDFIAKSIAEHKLALALHYPFIHAAVVGLNARRTFEFGAGGSTRVFLDALPKDGEHASLSMETPDQLKERHGVVGAGATWIHCCGKSEEYRSHNPGPLDLILHDGTHAADVAADIAWVWPHLKRFGLLLVHNTQRAEIRDGVQQGLAAGGACCSATTLPYGLGLTIIRREEGGPDTIVPAVVKAHSPYATEPVEASEQENARALALSKLTPNEKRILGLEAAC